MKRTLKSLAALSLLALLTGCAEQEAQSKDPNAFAKDTYSYSIPNTNESKPIEEISDVAINGDVMSAVGKTVDELSERYGAAREGLSDVYLFDNGLGWYNCGNNGSCQSVHGVKPADFLVGDVSTVTLDNLAEKCGFEVVPLNPTPDGQTMYEGYRMAYYTHPDYPNTSFELFYNENGFDETAEFSVRFNSGT